MNAIDELRREFPGFSFGPSCPGHAKAWKGPNEPVESDANLYALVERSSSGGFNGYPFRGRSAKFPTLLEAAEHALGEKAESTKAREGTVINAEVPPDPPSTQVRPAHYGGTGNPYECIKVIRAWGLNFELGNVAKYLSRAGKKPGVEAVDDLRKLITYAQMEIERLETKP